MREVMTMSKLYLCRVAEVITIIQIEIFSYSWSLNYIGLALVIPSFTSLKTEYVLIDEQM